MQRIRTYYRNRTPDTLHTYPLPVTSFLISLDFWRQMASAEALEIWECSICADILDSPRILPCACVFCLKHLDDLVNISSGRLICPSCSEDHPVPSGGVKAFPQIDEIIEDLCVFTAQREKLQNLGTGIELQIRKLQRSILKHVFDINDEFDYVIKLVEKRRREVLLPYKTKLRKLEALRFFEISKTNEESGHENTSVQDTSNLANTKEVEAKATMEDKARHTEEDLLKIREEVMAWKLCHPVAFKQQIEDLYAIIANYGQKECAPRLKYKLMHTIDGQESGHRFKDTRGLALCPQTDDVYVTCDRYLHKYNSDGKFKKKLKIDYAAYGITVDRRRNVIVTDVSCNKVRIYDYKLRLIRSFGTKGTEDGQFNGPFGVVCDRNDRIFIGDCMNRRVQIFTPKGQFLNKFGMEVLHWPKYLAFANDEKLVVSDSKSTVAVFTLSGDCGEFKRVPGMELLVKSPRGICVDSSGYILVADNFDTVNGQGKIHIFDTKLIHHAEIKNDSGRFGIIHGIAATKSGKIFVMDANGKLNIFHQIV